MGFRRRTRRRALVAGAAVAHHEDRKYAEAAAGRSPGARRRLPGPGASMRRLRRTRPTRSNTSHSCTPRARSQTKSSRRPRRRPSGLNADRKTLNRSMRQEQAAA